MPIAQSRQTSIRDALVTLLKAADGFSDIAPQILARNEGDISTQINTCLADYGIVIRVWSLKPSVNQNLPGIAGGEWTLQIEVQEWPPCNTTGFEAEDWAEALVLLLHLNNGHGITGLGLIVANPQPIDIGTEFDAQLEGDVTVATVTFRAQVSRAS